MLVEIEDKKELYNIIGDWSTADIRTDYKKGSSEIILKYKGKVILYKSEDPKHVAYIAWQCHAISAKEYDELSTQLN